MPLYTIDDKVVFFDIVDELHLGRVLSAHAYKPDFNWVYLIESSSSIGSLRYQVSEDKIISC